MKTFYSKIQISSSSKTCIVTAPGSCSRLGVMSRRGGAGALFRWCVLSPVHPSLRLSHHIYLPITSLPCLDPPSSCTWIFKPSSVVGIFHCNCFKSTTLPLSVHMYIYIHTHTHTHTYMSCLSLGRKKGNAKECSNYCTIALISHASK